MQELSRKKVNEPGNISLRGLTIQNIKKKLSFFVQALSCASQCFILNEIEPFRALECSILSKKAFCCASEYSIL